MCIKEITYFANISNLCCKSIHQIVLFLVCESQKAFTDHHCTSLKSNIKEDYFQVTEFLLHLAILKKSISWALRFFVFLMIISQRSRFISYCIHMVPSILMAGTEYFSLPLISLNHYLRVIKEASELTVDTDLQNLSVVQLRLSQEI